MDAEAVEKRKINRNALMEERRKAREERAERMKEADERRARERKDPVRIQGVEADLNEQVCIRACGGGVLCRRLMSRNDQSLE
jgi:hypothetical protein